MSLEKAIEVEGTITSVLPGTMFRVALANEHLVLAHISGKMRKRFIRLTIGDRVKLHMSPYDIDKARIVYRLGKPIFIYALFCPTHRPENKGTSYLAFAHPLPFDRKTNPERSNDRRKLVGRCKN